MTLLLRLNHLNVFASKKHSKIIKIRYEETNDYHDSHGNDYADGGFYALDQGRF